MEVKANHFDNNSQIYNNVRPDAKVTGTKNPAIKLRFENVPVPDPKSPYIVI